MKMVLIHFVLRSIAPRLIILLEKSLRLKWVNDGVPRDAERPGERRIYCFWHNRLLIMPAIYRRLKNRKTMCAMVSRSRDGQYIADVLEAFGFVVTRGSSSRGGGAALKKMVKLLRQGLDAAVVPDGPRGPCYTFREGAVLLSQLSGVPLVPVSYQVRRKICVKSWDRFMLPVPFSRGVFIWGDPVTISRDETAEGREKIRARLEATMREFNRRAAEMAGVPEE